MKNSLKIASAALMVMIAASCSKNTDTGIALSFKAITTLPSLKKSAAATGYNFTEALMGIKEIEIKREEEELHDSTTVRDTLKHKFDFKGKYLLDLLTGTSTPDLGFTDFVPGIYNKFESETARLVEGGKSISVKGTFTDSTSTVFTFDFSTKGEFEFEFESDSGFALTEGKILEMLININLPMLFSNVDFSKGTADANKVIVINETTNYELFRKIRHNIHSIAEMHEDHDHKHKHHRNN
jgi:hypothetical protein